MSNSDEKEELKIQVVRLEERVIALDRKTDLYHQEAAQGRLSLSGEVAKMSHLVEAALENYNKRIEENRDKINELRRDRTWVITIFGVLWGAMLAWIEWRAKG